MKTFVGSQESNVGIVGVGKMGGAIQQALERNGYQVAGVGRDDDLTAIDGCRFVILGMKPQSLDDSTAADIAAHTDTETITISLLAGTTIEQLVRQGFTSVAPLCLTWPPLTATVLRLYTLEIQ